MGKKAKKRFIKEKREALVDVYNRYLSEYGKDNPKVLYIQRQIENFDKEYNQQKG